MKVFISWSGEKSKQVALLLEEWIKMVIQASQPWVSTNIESGSLWFQELNEQLKDVSIGIVCITAENKDKPWIHFEAGALAKGLSTNRVCTLLVDLKNEDVEQPLAQFNHTSTDKEGMHKLITTINNQSEKEALPQHILQKVFDTFWPEFESRFQKIADKPTPSVHKSPKRGSDDILNEVLQTVRSFDKRLQSVEVVQLEKSHQKLLLEAELQGLLSLLRSKEVEYYEVDEIDRHFIGSEITSIKSKIEKVQHAISLSKLP